MFAPEVISIRTWNTFLGYVSGPAFCILITSGANILHTNYFRCYMYPTYTLHLINNFTYQGKCCWIIRIQKIFLPCYFAFSVYSDTVCLSASVHTTLESGWPSGSHASHVTCEVWGVSQSTLNWNLYYLDAPANVGIQSFLISVIAGWKMT
jgi:hypothetical protein